MQIVGLGFVECQRLLPAVAVNAGQLPIDRFAQLPK